VPRDTFEVVFVCTGNRARSALAEALFRHHALGKPTIAWSVGTLDAASLPALPDAMDAGRRLGVDLSGHSSRALREADLSSTDLVLGFEPFHVSTSVVTGRANPARTFLLGELVMLLGNAVPGGDPAVRARAAVRDADQRRALYPPDWSTAVIEDPIGKPARTMRRTAAEIDKLVQRLVLGLFGDQQSALAHTARIR
jgi:protein-tyrosine phosphatase